MPRETSKSMFGNQLGNLETLNLILTATYKSVATVGNPKTAEDITKLVNIYDALETRLKSIRR
jgi:hypothetical protein